MQVSTITIPEKLKELYISAGIAELYPPQAKCIDEGLLTGRNLLISIPTASGKTLIAEMAMHQHIANGGKCLYTVPLKALASEKFDEFGNKGVKIGIATGDLDRRDDMLGRNDIIVATSEKVDSLLRNSSSWIADITLLVIDEIHLIDSDGRGPTLEMVIAKLRDRNPRMQIIGLSATIGNPQLLAGWLDAGLITSTWRPVDLRQGVFCDNRIYFRESERKIKTVSKNYDDINSSSTRLKRAASASSLSLPDGMPKRLQNGRPGRLHATIPLSMPMPTNSSAVPRPRWERPLLPA